MAAILNLQKDGSSFSIKNETIVFVSYIREDREAASRICSDLKDADLNLKPWIDTGILAGQNWENEIKKAIKACRYFIPLISSKAVEKKGYTKKEFEYALKIIKETQEIQKIIVIPVRLDECKVPYSELEKIQRVDLFPDWKEGFEKILRAIKEGDNLVKGHQFEGEKNLARLKVLKQTIRHPFNRNSTSDNLSLSSSMLLLLGSTMVIDKNSIANPRYSNHTPYSFSSRFGSKGSRDGQFDNPTGIAIDPLTDHVYVADKDNHRIQKFDSNGIFIAKWGSKGSRDGQFDKPESLCINTLNGCIFVAEPSNHRIQSFVIPRTDEWIRKGIFSFSLTKYEEALECFERAIEIDQKYAYAWINKGVSFYQLGKYNGALECFERAIEIDQKYAYAWINKGVSFYQLGKYNGALECFERAIEIDEKYAYAWINKGKSLIHKGRYQDAIKSFERAIEIDENNVEGWINKGLTYYLLNEYDRAIKCFNQSLKIIPPNDGALYFRGCSKVKKGQIEEGLEDISNAIKINSKLITSLRLGQWLRKHYREITVTIETGF